MIVPFARLYEDDSSRIEHQKHRYETIARSFYRHFGCKAQNWFSTPGRTEIGGNHTDHNHGRVLAASVNLDAVAAVKKSDDRLVVLVSEGYASPFEVDLNELNKREDEIGTTSALIRGVAAYLREKGYRIGGFKAFVHSAVLPGSGLSSSAAIEVLIGTIFNHLYNQGQIPAQPVAVAGQFAENEYFGKPCGLMDQMACAMGGIIAIDFKNPAAPLVEQVPFDFSAQGYRLLVVNTGGSHADLTEDYASVPAEMKAVARFLGKSVCREIDMNDWLEKLPALRKNLGDRAVLRAFHFIRENERVMQQVKALKENRFETFLSLLQDSGNSSFKWLQNIYSPKNAQEQGISLALALSEDFIRSVGQGASRVHGGGFAGTIQVFLPEEVVDKYVRRMEAVFGKGCVHVLNIRPWGSVQVQM
jgi:galactokinase